MREVDVGIIGGEEVGRALARALEEKGVSVLLLEPYDSSLEGGDRRVAPAYPLDVLTPPSKRVVSGISWFDLHGRVEVARARCVVLSSGGCGALSGRNRSCTGPALAARVGATIVRVGEEVGVETDEGGRTGVPGLWAIGRDSSSFVGVERAVSSLLADLPKLRFESLLLPYYPNLDTPLPATFAEIKFERIRGLWNRSPLALHEIERIKGEADEYARARLDPRLKELQNAAHVVWVLAGGGRLNRIGEET